MYVKFYFLGTNQLRKGIPENRGATVENQIISVDNYYINDSVTLDVSDFTTCFWSKLNTFNALSNPLISLASSGETNVICRNVLFHTSTADGNSKFLSIF